MNYRGIAKSVIRLYAKYCVDKGHQFSTYDEYKTVFYWIISSILGTTKIIDFSTCIKYVDLKNEVTNEIKRSKLLKNITHKGSKEILFDVIVAMFDIVIKELKEEQEQK